MSDPVAECRRDILEKCLSRQLGVSCELCRKAAENLLKMEVHLACHERTRDGGPQ